MRLALSEYESTNSWFGRLLKDAIIQNYFSRFSFVDPILIRFGDDPSRNGSGYAPCGKFQYQFVLLQSSVQSSRNWLETAARKIISKNLLRRSVCVSAPVSYKSFSLIVMDLSFRVLPRLVNFGNLWEKFQRFFRNLWNLWKLFVDCLTVFYAQV